VRALARDLGAALGVGGHLTALRRTRVGPFDIAAAATLEELAEDLRVLDLDDAARALFPVRELDEAETLELSHGRRIAAGEPAAPGTPPAAAFAPDGRLVALLENRGAQARPLLVFAPGQEAGNRR
jgi:tRNA pseudouridine55 synthase